MHCCRTPRCKLWAPTLALAAATAEGQTPEKLRGSGSLWRRICPTGCRRTGCTFRFIHIQPGAHGNFLH